MVNKFRLSGNVSIHAPTRGATNGKGRAYGSIPCFNPRTHTGCDWNRILPYKAGDVSIHAPTRGATGVQRGGKWHGRFQSTHPHGVRPDFRERLKNQRDVSIHAPTRGATRSNSGLDTRQFCFNPRTHTGCDTSHLDVSKHHIWFQSTHPHGVRQGLTFTEDGLELFQSTHPHGVRRVWNAARAKVYFSFNPRTHTGCDSAEIDPKSCICGFNPRTHTGCDKIKG